MTNFKHNMGKRKTDIFLYMNYKTGIDLNYKMCV